MTVESSVFNLLFSVVLLASLCKSSWFRCQWLMVLIMKTLKLIPMLTREWI